jgi:peptidoglycan L-alanyl-D-glutamate endopeptidase CwlK
MPSFSKESLSKLSTCHIDLQVLFFEVIKHFDCKVLEGYRAEIDQNKAFDEGKSKLKFPYGKHNSLPSNAIDVCPYPVPDWKNIRNFLYFGGFVMGLACKLKDEGKISHSIRYGGDFDMDNDVTNQKFVDAVHFELII